MDAGDHLVQPLSPTGRSSRACRRPAPRPTPAEGGGGLIERGASGGQVPLQPRPLRPGDPADVLTIRDGATRGRQRRLAHKPGRSQTRPLSSGGNLAILGRGEPHVGAVVPPLETNTGETALSRPVSVWSW